MASSPKFQNLVEMYDRSVERYTSRDLFGTRKHGAWAWTTYRQFGAMVDDLRGGLASLGIQRGNRAANVSDNRVEWAAANFACLTLGAALVPMYEAQLAKEWAFICDECSAVAILAATEDIAKKCREIALGSDKKASTLKHVIAIDAPKTDPLSFASLLDIGRDTPVPAIQPEARDIACLIDTSGTTGNPKGVVLSHGNIASNICAVHDLSPLGGEDGSLSFLPWAHAVSHTELEAPLSLGGSLALCDDLAKVQPTVLMSVPRIFNRLYDSVGKQMALQPKPVEALVRRLLGAASKQRRGEPIGVVDTAALAVADKVAFSKLRAKFGGRLKYACSGGAALSRDVAEFIDNLGITVYEGYGLTETSPIATTNRPGARRIGSVGQAIPGVKIVIDKSMTGEAENHGEIIADGPNVMQGYHHRDEENKAAFTADGGFHTGDLGYLDADGYLFITGRIKEPYKLENGKYVAPAPLEEQLTLSPYIVSAMVYGDNRLYNVALVVPDIAATRAWAIEHGVNARSDDALIRSPEVRARLEAEVQTHSSEFKRFERIKRVAVIAEEFTVANGLLTPSLKTKRSVAVERFAKEFESLYEVKTAATPAVSS